jgi:hypothetical protein
MWQDQELLKHFETSSSITSSALVISEWNMNNPNNILNVGNYRYRPYERLTESVAAQSSYASLQNEYDSLDLGEFWTDATDADVLIDGGYSDSTSLVPEIFKSKKDKENLLYSLEDCFGRFRPRSGVNKVRYLENTGQYLNAFNYYLSRRPRFYMAHKDDNFKYWTSYRTENGFERGIATKFFGGRYYIDDTAPFIVYKDAVPANRIIVKMQTGVGDIDLGPFQNNANQFDDPFFGAENMSVPQRWAIQYLKGSSWTTALSFDENSLRSDGSQIIGPDGYIEVYYGLKIPTKYKYFRNVGEYVSESSLPIENKIGHAYLVGSSETAAGAMHVWNGFLYESFVPEYGWQLKNEGSQDDYGNAKDLVNPSKFVNPITSKLQYRELEYISGLRVVVETMSKNDAVFDLIELSPRLSINLTERVQSYNITKPASDLGVSGMPVGQLLAGTGTVEIFDYDRAFSESNSESLISKYISQSMQIKFYEVIESVGEYDYFIPIKTMYSEGFPAIDDTTRSVSVALRDLYFFFEYMQAPQLFLTDVSLSYAVSVLLDYIGFTNYIFDRVDDESEPVIPSFFVKPDMSVAQVLQDLAISTQSVMFFDEYNNFVVMSKNYMMPTEDQRATDLILYGSQDSSPSGVVRGQATSKLANIKAIASQEKKVYNAGKISYTSRYLERDTTLDTALNKFAKDKAWAYKRAELWSISSERSGSKKQNGVDMSGSYSLSAIPLDSDLSDVLPYVSNNRVLNNTISFGEGILFLDRYNGYFYSNGEVIRYDAVQYSIPGLVVGDDTEDGSTVWITSPSEYEKYFSQIPFNGKMFPTGLVKIYAEPRYETINGVSRMKSGAVARHGRCQFGTGSVGTDGKTNPVYHSAGLNPYWSDNENVRGLKLESKHLFTSSQYMSSNFRISSAQIVENVATITTSTDHDFEVGDAVTILEVGESYDGQHDITVVDTNVFSFATDLEDSAIESVNASGAIAFVSKYDASNSSATAGQANAIGRRSTRQGIIKNYLSNYYLPESDGERLYSTETSTSQSSSLIFSGGTFLSTESPIDYLSYIHKPLTNNFKSFGTRVRIIGKQENDENRLQTPVGVMSYYGVSEPLPEQLATIGGASAGLSVMVDPNKNTGYYFEIAALTADNVTSYSDNGNINDVIFYKVLGSGGKAVPVKLWSGYAGIIVNSGEEIGQARFAAEENPSIYDLAVEYQDIGSVRRFYLYINQSLVQIVDDESPLPIINNMALFVRGTSRAMFENVYALTTNYAQNTATSLNLPATQIFGSDSISTDEAFRKYALSGVVQSAYLGSISPSEPPAYNIYYDEFGTIMREAAYFNVKYDKAYPALIAKMQSSFSKLKGYTISGFMAGAYGAEFLVFNATDSTLILGDETNSLIIAGVTFTTESQQDYTVDDYFNQRSDFSKPVIFGETIIRSPEKVSQDYFQIKTSRIEHGRNEFSLNLPYLQTPDEAEGLMEWLVSNIMKPRLAVGVDLFANPMIQLGDIVTISYSQAAQGQQEEYSILRNEDTRFVVYNISYSRDQSGPSMMLYLSEVG